MKDLYPIGILFMFGFLCVMEQEKEPWTIKDSLIILGCSIIWPFTLGIIVGLAIKVYKTSLGEV